MTRTRKFDYPYRVLRIHQYGVLRKVGNVTTQDDLRYGVFVDNGYSTSFTNCEEKDLLKTVVRSLELPDTKTFGFWKKFIKNYTDPIVSHISGSQRGRVDLYKQSQPQTATKTFWEKVLSKREKVYEHLIGAI